MYHLQVIIRQKYRVSDLRCDLFLTMQLLSYHNRKCNIGKVYQEDQSFIQYIRLGLRKLSLPDEQVSKIIYSTTTQLLYSFV